jgi:hypothetical protein
VLRRPHHADLEEVVHHPEAGHAAGLGVAGDGGERRDGLMQSFPKL